MSTQLPLLSMTSASKRLYHGSCTERSRWALFSSFCIPSSPAIITLLRSPLVHRRVAPSAARPPRVTRICKFAASPPLTPTAPDCLAVSRRGGDLVPPLRPLPPPPRRTRLPPQYAGCARGVRFIQGRRPARPTNLWIFSFPTPDEVFQLPTDSVFVLCLCFTPVVVNAAPEPAPLPCRPPPSRPLPVVDEMLSGTECLLSSTSTDVSHTCRVLWFTLKVVAYKNNPVKKQRCGFVDRDIHHVGVKFFTILP